MRALDTCPFLKTVTVDFESNYEINIIQAICRKEPGLLHVAMRRGTLDKNTCLEIKNMLSSEDSVLKSLKFDSVEFDDTAIVLIGNGIAENKSLKHFYFRFSTPRTVKSLLGLFENHRLHVLETVALCSTTDIHSYPEITDVVQQMPMLQSLTLDVSYPLTLKSIFLALSPFSTLKMLRVEGCIDNDNVLQHLGTLLATTRH